MKRTIGITAVFLMGVGAARVAMCACDALAHAMTIFGSWHPDEAAAVAPWILMAVVTGLGISLWGLHEDNKRYSRSGYGRVMGYSARHKTQQDNEEVGA